MYVGFKYSIGYIVSVSQSFMASLLCIGDIPKFLPVLCFYTVFIIRVLVFCPFVIHIMSLLSVL